MSSIVFGFILISAALQTGFAVLAEGDFIVVPLTILAILMGVRSFKNGIGRIRYQVSLSSGATKTHVIS